MPIPYLLKKKKIFLHSENFYCGFLWHIFSYEKVKHYSNELAIKYLENKLNKKLIVFFQFYDDVITINLKENKQIFLNWINNVFEDIYIVDESFSWTFVKTHESYCGPYFTTNTLINN